MNDHNIQERMQDPVTPYKILAEEIRRGLHTCFPGIIMAFDPSTQTASVQPAIRCRASGAKGADYIAMPLLESVPVFCPGGGGYALTMPIQKGDECLVLIADSCIDAWWQSGGVQNPMVMRSHSLSDAFCFVGFRSRPNAIADHDMQSPSLAGLTLPASDVFTKSGASVEQALLADRERIAEKMAILTYDQDQDGIVDDAQRLGGNAPDFYAAQQDMAAAQAMLEALEAEAQQAQEDIMHIGTELVQAQGTIADLQEDAADAQADITAMRTEMEGELAAMDAGKAPVSHASKSNIYGPATTTNWGHVTLGSDIPQDSTASGSAGTANGNVANANHRHRYPAQLLYSSDGIEARYALVASDTITTFRPVDAAITNNLGATTYRYDTIYLKNNPNVSSDEREKKDIAPIDEAFDLIMGIEPVKFRRKDNDKVLHYGMIAQQLRDTVKGLGVNDSGLYSRDSIEEDIPNDDATEDQVRYGVYYTELIAPLIAVVQQQQKRIKALEVAVYG